MLSSVRPIRKAGE